MIFINDKFGFIHIPKTGGFWITSIISKSDVSAVMFGDRHSTYDYICGATYIINSQITKSLNSNGEVLRRHPLVIQDKKINYFCVVRNPLKWCESWFKYQCDREWKHCGILQEPLKYHPMSPLNFDKSFTDFNDFLEFFNNRAPGFLVYLYNSYTMSSNAFVLKIENIRNELSELNSMWNIGLDDDLIHTSDPVNVSSELELTWSRKNFEKTVELNLAAFKAFNYPWEGVVNIE